VISSLTLHLCFFFLLGCVCFCTKVTAFSLFKMAFYMPYNHVTLRHFSIFHRRITTSAAGKNGMLFGRVWAGLRTRSPATTKAAALPGWILPLSRDRVPAAWRFLQHVPSVEDEKALATRSQDSGAHQESTTGELKDHVRETHTDKTVGVKGEAVGEGEDSMKNGNKKNKKSILESIYKAKEKNSTLTAKRRETRSERKTKMKEKNKAEETKRETPLDQFFTSFEGFTYDAHLSPEASFKSLRRYKGWKSTKDDGPGKDALSRYQKALVEEVKMWFGNEKDLTAWWTLCKAVGRYDPPGNIRECAAVCFFIGRCLRERCYL
jgi:hypothetical protein